MPTINFLAPCIFDHGAIARLPDVLKKLQVSRPMIITDAGIRAIGLLDRALDHLDRMPTTVFDQTQANPTETQAILTAKSYRQADADGIVAIGGGSSMDLAKAVGLLVSHDGTLSKYAARTGGARFIGKIPPLVAIPTTAGTGSEVSVGLVVTLQSGFKETIVSPHLVPATAICDPDLTFGLPAALTAATGMDAVTHCIEAVLNPAINPPAEAIGYDGLNRAIHTGALRRAVTDGSDRQARWNMMMASHEGALAFTKGLGGVHALSHATGRLQDRKLHHGTLNAIFLPHVLRFGAGAAPEKQARLKAAMGLDDTDCLADAIERLNADIGLPSTLEAIGVTMDDGPGIVENALLDIAHTGNVRPMERDDYEQIFCLALGQGNSMSPAEDSR